MMKRKRLTKAQREAVYAKYGGHCAYCGREIGYDEMAVDHAVAIGSAYYGNTQAQFMEAEGSMNADWNLMPSCRQCNFYKGMNDIEGFRRRIQDQLSHTCQDSFQTRLAMQFGIMQYKGWDGKFYFEKALIEKFNG